MTFRWVISAQRSNVLRRRVWMCAVASCTLLCAGCSIGESDDTLRAKYLRQPDREGLIASGLRDVAIGGTVGAVLGAMPSMVPSQYRHHALVAAVVLDAAAIAVLADHQVYTIGAAMSREKNCPLLIEARDLELVVSAMQTRAGHTRKIAEAAVVPALGVAVLAGKKAPRAAGLVPLVVANGAVVSSEVARHIGGPGAGALIGFAVNSGALVLVGATARDFYRGKSVEVCKETK